MRVAFLLSDVVLALVVIVFAASDDAPRPQTSTPSASAKANTPPKPKSGDKEQQSAATPEETPAAAAVTETAPPSPYVKEEAAIRETGVTFAKAYNAGDAAAVAAHFTPDAEYVDEEGNLFQGRKEIEEALADYFEENPDSQLEVTVDSIRFVSAGVAIEDGSTTVVHSEGGLSDESFYTAIHVLVDGEWLTASSREHAPKNERQHSTQLEQLDWLLGDWVDEDDDAVVEFSCQLVDNGNFLLRHFVVKIAGEEAQSGTQRIGWDPVTGKLRTWIFDSDGGYGEGTWRRDGENWVLKTTGVTADGQSVSGTSIYTLVNDHLMTWQGVDHEIAGESCEDSEVITIVRKPPTPVVEGNPLAQE